MQTYGACEALLFNSAVKGASRGPRFETGGTCEALVLNSAVKRESAALVLDSVGKQETDIEYVISTQS